MKNVIRNIIADRHFLLVACRYADGANAYWTGFFTSRPALKGYIRMLSGYYMVTYRNFFISYPYIESNERTQSFNT